MKIYEFILFILFLMFCMPVLLVLGVFVNIWNSVGLGGSDMQTVEFSEMW